MFGVSEIWVVAAYGVPFDESRLLTAVVSDGGFVSFFYSPVETLHLEVAYTRRKLQGYDPVPRP